MSGGVSGGMKVDGTIVDNTLGVSGVAFSGAGRQRHPRAGHGGEGACGAIWVNAGALAADTNTVNIAIGSSIKAVDRNTMQHSDPSNATDVFLDRSTCAGCGSTLNLYRNGSGAAGSSEALIRQILVDGNIATLELGAGFTNGSRIGTPAGAPPLPS